jgi:hypothetical protein
MRGISSLAEELKKVKLADERREEKGNHER